MDLKLLKILLILFKSRKFKRSTSEPPIIHLFSDLKIILTTRCLMFASIFNIFKKIEDLEYYRELDAMNKYHTLVKRQLHEIDNCN